MNLTKKQVKAFLEVLSSDTARPVLTQANIDSHNGKMCLVATDGYVLAAIAMDESTRDLKGRRVTREDITKWYKLASNKDRFTEENVCELAKETYTDFGEKDTEDKLHGAYPEWQRLIPTGDRSSICGVGLNAKYILTMQTLAEKDKGVELDFYGETAPVLIRDGDSLYVIMPLKR